MNVINTEDKLIEYINKVCACKSNGKGKQTSAQSNNEVSMALEDE